VPPPERFPWSWTAPAILVIGITAGVGAVRYPGLSSRIPAHFAVDGAVDRTVPTTVLTAFLPVGIQLMVTAVLIACAAVTLRAGGRSRRAARATARSLLWLAACLNLANYFLAEQIWSRHPGMGPPTIAGVVIATAAGLLGVVATVGYASRTPSDRTRAELDHWRGVIYVNRDDPALFVPKRFGIGWTLNFGRPASWVVLGALVAVVIAGPFLGAYVR
jgi:uncharacterized membrane protein